MKKHFNKTPVFAIIGFALAAVAGFVLISMAVGKVIANNDSDLTVSLQKIDDYSPDRIIKILDDSNHEITDVKEIRYLDGVTICSGENLSASVFDFADTDEVIVIRSDDSEIHAKVNKMEEV